MSTNIYRFILVILILLVIKKADAQEKSWTLNDCINYALEKNIEVQQAGLSNKKYRYYSEQSRASRLPSVNASVSQNFNWSRQYDQQTDSYTGQQASNTTNFSLNSSVTLFNGMKTNNEIKQSELELLSSEYYSETVKESIELNVLDAFLQLLYAQENIINAEKQIEATSEQLALATERLNLGVISQSDYLQIKSELATEKLTLANAKSQLIISRLNLMQLLEIPADSSFTIATPDLSNIESQDKQPNASEVFATALDIKPQIKQIEIQKESKILDEKIARAGLYPVLSLNAGIGTGYSSTEKNYDYYQQLNNQFSEYVGLTLSIPIFQKKQVKTSISVAKVGIEEAELELINTKNTLRKEVEQAVANVLVAQEQYEAGIEEYNVTVEAGKVADEKYRQGLLNSVDLLLAKTNLIKSESQVLQSKYQLIFSYKVLDFYNGIPLTL